MANKITPLSTVVLVAIMIIITSSAMAFEKKGNPFRFEDYKSGEEAQVALLKLHPVGNKIEDVVNTLEKAGAKCAPTTNPEYKDKPEYRNKLYCVYYAREFFFFSSEWRVILVLNPSNMLDVLSLEIYKFSQSL